MAFASAPESISKIEKGSKELTCPSSVTLINNQKKRRVKATVIAKLYKNVWFLKSVAIPESFFRASALLFSALVRETAPIDASSAKRTFLKRLIMKIHAENKCEEVVGKFKKELRIQEIEILIDESETTQKLSKVRVRASVCASNLHGTK